jgi:hypothetical protein
MVMIIWCAHFFCQAIMVHHIFILFSGKHSTMFLFCCEVNEMIRDNVIFLFCCQVNVMHYFYFVVIRTQQNVFILLSGEYGALYYTLHKSFILIGGREGFKCQVTLINIH